ncbi:BCL2 [Cordylochernes scorpioides]|uniref:BCL2 n=1 Tax=Cordylochernes scorpioides TaxID=51811 RepID=A0ABY6LF15_9ARAC|nr:BCL2 [Cordylochernes scorpioides]
MAAQSIDAEVAAIVYDYLIYQLGQKGYQWTSPVELRPPSKVNLTLRSLGDEFKTRYIDRITEMCNSLEIEQSSAQETFLGVVNELFSEGVKWARIVAFFVFGAELAILCKQKDTPQLIDDIAQWITAYITNHLKIWINEHGGWCVKPLSELVELSLEKDGVLQEGLIGFAEGRDPEKKDDNSWPSFKNFVCGVAAGALGALTLGAILTSKS